MTVFKGKGVYAAVAIGKVSVFKRQAAAVRKEREKNAYIDTDNDTIIENLKSRISTLKYQLISEFSAVNTAKDMENLNDKLKWYKGFEGILRDFEFIVENDSKKAFSSIERFDQAVNELNAKIDRLMPGIHTDSINVLDMIENAAV